MEPRCKTALSLLGMTETEHERWRIPSWRTQIHIKRMERLPGEEKQLRSAQCPANSSNRSLSWKSAFAFLMPDKNENKQQGDHQQWHGSTPYDVRRATFAVWSQVYDIAPCKAFRCACRKPSGSEMLRRFLCSTKDLPNFSRTKPAMLRDLLSKYASFISSSFSAWLMILLPAVLFPRKARSKASLSSFDRRSNTLRLLSSENKYVFPSSALSEAIPLLYFTEDIDVQCLLFSWYTWSLAISTSLISNTGL